MVLCSGYDMNDSVSEAVSVLFITLGGEVGIAWKGAHSCREDKQPGRGHNDIRGRSIMRGRGPEHPERR